MKNLSRRSFLHNVGTGVGRLLLRNNYLHIINIFKPNASKYDGKKLNIALCGLGRYAGYLAKVSKLAKYCRIWQAL